MSEPKAKTIQDLATRLGLSKSTVSRALNDNPVIAEQTRRRVAEAAQEMRFTKNISAQRLSNRSSRTIAFVVHQTNASQAADLFGMEMLSGISQGLQALGYETLLKPIDYRDYSWVRQLLDSGQVDGFVLMTSNRKSSHVKALIKENAPFIAWGSAPAQGQYPTVSGDNYRGGYLVGQHLAQLGSFPLGLIAGPEDEGEVQARTQGFLDGLKDGHAELQPTYIRYGDFSEADGQKLMGELLSLNPRPKAVFAQGDLMAIGALKEARSRSLAIPSELAIVGFDGLLLSGYTDPPLTTVSQHLMQAGIALAEGLVRYLETGQVSHIIMPVELLKRGSA